MNLNISADVSTPKAFCFKRLWFRKNGTFPLVLTYKCEQIVGIDSDTNTYGHIYKNKNEMQLPSVPPSQLEEVFQLDLGIGNYVYASRDHIIPLRYQSSISMGAIIKAKNEQIGSYTNLLLEAASIKLLEAEDELSKAEKKFYTVHEEFEAANWQVS